MRGMMRREKLAGQIGDGGGLRAIGVDRDDFDVFAAGKLEQLEQLEALEAASRPPL